MAELEIDTEIHLLDQKIATWNFRVEPWITDKLETRIRNGLQRAGIHTVRDLLALTKHQVLDIQGIGIVCVVAVLAGLERSGLSLAERET